MELQLEQSQKHMMSLTPGMLHSLQFLSTPVYELNSVLLPLLYENPMLEFEETYAEQSSESAAIQEGSIVEISEIDDPYWDVFPDHGKGISAIEFFSESSRGQSLTEYLEEQLLFLPLDTTMHQLCRYVIWNLDSRGYLEVSPAAIAEELHIDLFSVMQAVYAVQLLQPIGVGARNLAECLTLQLAQSPNFCSQTLHLVAYGLPLLAKNDWKQIAALLDCSIEQAVRYGEMIRELNPIPAAGFAGVQENHYIIPDAYIECADGTFRIRMNRSGVPNLEINVKYLKLMETTQDVTLQKYLHEKLSQAKNVISALENRSSTIERVLCEIVTRQLDFFEKGSPPVPMQMSALAQDMGLNVSTISRAVRGKYVHFSRGTVALRKLFMNSVDSSGDGVVSADLIISKIKQLIAVEDTTKPLSDETIRLALKASQINISRRTVTKYREMANIPSSRKRQKKISPR